MESDCRQTQRVPHHLRKPHGVPLKKTVEGLTTIAEQFVFQYLT
jgi:hypothetical protein